MPEQIGPCQSCAPSRVVLARICACKGRVTQESAPASNPRFPQNPAGTRQWGKQQVGAPLCLQPSQSWPWPPATWLGSHPASSPRPAPHRHHRLLPPFPAGGGRWKRSSSSRSEWLKGCEGGGTGPPPFPLPLELGRTTSAAEGEKRKGSRTEGTVCYSAMLSGFWLRPVYLVYQILWLSLVCLITL